MANQCEERGEAVERPNGSPLAPPPTAVWLRRVEQGVEAALHPHTGEAHHGFQRLYEAVRERTVELKRVGCRVEHALMTIKREIASSAAAKDDADPTRVAALLDAVVRWCVGAYYMANGRSVSGSGS
jgi:hypothetical protein